MTIIKKTVGDNKMNWDSKMKHALWVNRITKKEAMGKSPFELVYGMDVTLPIHLNTQCISYCNISHQIMEHFKQG
jgi:hypothetical protein